jgi:hypothetical protein
MTKNKVGMPLGKITTRTRDLNVLFNNAFGNEAEFNKLIVRTKEIIATGNDKESAALLRYVFDRLLGKTPDVIDHRIQNNLTIEDVLGAADE